MESSASQYEFTAAQNEVLAKAARWVTLFAWAMILSALIMTIAGVASVAEGSVGPLISAAVYFVIGMNFRSSAASMKKVVRTEGNDIEHLVEAVDNLADAFQVMGILILVGGAMVAGVLILFGTGVANGGL